MATLVPDIDAFEERAAILEYEAGLSSIGGRRPSRPSTGVSGCCSLSASAGRLPAHGQAMTLSLGGDLRGLRRGPRDFPLLFSPQKCEAAQPNQACGQRVRQRYGRSLPKLNRIGSNAWISQAQVITVPILTPKKASDQIQIARSRRPIRCKSNCRRR